ncbi:MAG: hypothetical protein ACJ8EY_02205 [Sphingomicrobium sp.]
MLFFAVLARGLGERVAVAPVPLLFAEDRLLLVVEDFARAALDLARVDLARPVEDFADVERPLEGRAAVPEPEELLLLPDEVSSPPQRPARTRCAASATASAMIEPRRVALDTAAEAALLALSAASRPASRILRRAAGLALIAAAAAARPAASISRLIAAFVILSTVLSLDVEEEVFFLPDLAILRLPLSNQRHFKAVTVPYRRSNPWSSRLKSQNSSDVQGLVAKQATMVPAL